MAKILVTRKLPSSVLSKLEASADIDLHTGETAMSADELPRELRPTLGERRRRQPERLLQEPRAPVCPRVAELEEQRGHVRGPELGPEPVVIEEQCALLGERIVRGVAERAHGDESA